MSAAWSSSASEGWRKACRATLHSLQSKQNAMELQHPLTTFPPQSLEEHQRGVCGSEGNGVHAVEHGKCTGGDIRLRGGRGVGVHGRCSRGNIRHTRKLRGGQWQYGEDGGGGMERAAAVGRRGWAARQCGWAAH